MTRRIPDFLLPIRNWQIELYKCFASRKHPYPVLQGSCIIVSCSFIRENDKLFFPETELYCEEQILAARCRKFKYKVIYDRKLKIIHKGSVSTNADFTDNRNRIIQTYERMIKARYIYLSYITENE